MDLHKYYQENKDDINSSIMEIASDLAVGRLVDKYKQPFEAFIDPDDPDSSTHYKEEFQDEYNRFYDEEYDRVAQLMKFDITASDGIALDYDESHATEVKTIYYRIVPKSDTPDSPHTQSFYEQLTTITNQLIRNICQAKERPEGWLPHVVYVEEEGDYPVYTMYKLEEIRPDGTCTLFNPKTDERDTQRHLYEINIDWLVTVWNRYQELCVEQHLHSVMDEKSVKPNLPPFRNGDFVRLTDDAIAEVRRIFGGTPADYRRNMLLQVKYVQQDSADGSWHIGVQDIHEDDVQEFIANFLRPAPAEDIRSLSGREKQYAFVWSCNHLKRKVSDTQLIEAWQNGLSRSVIDSEDETEYEVERLTLDELAERINDECFNDNENYIRFIPMND